MSSGYGKKLWIWEESAYLQAYGWMDVKKTVFYFSFRIYEGEKVVMWKIDVEKRRSGGKKLHEKNEYKQIKRKWHTANMWNRKILFRKNCEKLFWTYLTCSLSWVAHIKQYYNLGCNNLTLVK